VAAVVLDAGQVTMFEGDSRTLVATAKDAAGRVITGREVSWSSSAPDVATVDAAGRVSAVNLGRAMVTATVEGQSATAMVTVSPAPVATIAISHSALVVEIGEQRQLSATLKDARGNVLQGRSVQWSVDNNVMTITQAGVITGVRNGYVTITATSEGVSTSVGTTIVAPEAADYDLVYYWMNGTGSELFTLDLAYGGAPVRLNAGNVSHSPTASPDGQRVAFAVAMQELGTGNWIHDIFAVDRNGMNMKRLTTAPGYDEWPEWSPAGGKIAFQRVEPGGRSDIWVMNEDGGNQVSLTSDMPDGGVRSHASWSRDGSRIAFQQSLHGPTGTTASIWIMNADGTNKLQLTSTLTGFDAGPTWSPDGTRLAFTRYYGADDDITIIDINSGALTRIPLAGLQANPAWSPDGQLIAFTSGNGVYTMEPDGSRVRLRTVDPSWGGGIAPAWIAR
jgi:dipeptidyl aminopeptidase/acylaminoacyl peptidase